MGPSSAKNSMSIWERDVSSYSIQLPLDSDGFLRRECPHCLGEFKWHHGPVDDQSEEQEQAEIPSVYHCPLCSATANLDSWWTQEQLRFAEESAAGPAMNEIQNALARALHNNKHITFEPGRGDGPLPPVALHEPDDMTILAPPCHPAEPIKIPESRLGTAIYCLSCGTAFTG